MTLSQFLEVVRRRWRSIALVLFLGVVTAAGVTSAQTPQYRSSSAVFVSVAGGDSAADLSQGNTFSAARVKSYTELASTPRVLGRAAEALGMDPADVGELASRVQAESTPDTVLITITATDPAPERSAAIANAVTDELIASIDEVERTKEDAAGIVHLSVFQEAIPPALPYTPRTTVNLAIGALGGLALGLAQALLRTVLDNRLRTVEQLRQITDASILTELPVADPQDHPLVDSGNRYSTRAEAFRQLRTHLSFTNLDGETSQSIVITSATPGEGKSSTAVNLALVLAQNGSRVVLVDADMRRPTVATVLGIESRVGLSTVLSRQVELDDAIQPLGGDAPFDVLAAGRVPPNPSELLGSGGMAALLTELRQRYDHIVVDAPPLLPVTDPAVLGAMSSGVVLVAAVDGRVRRSEIEEAIGRLDQVGVRLLGIALNRVPAKRRGTSYYNYEATTPVSESPRRVSRARRFPPGSPGTAPTGGTAA